MPTREDISIGSNSGIASQIPNGKTYLFFIAIDEYRNGVTRLSNAVRDARTVSECLLEHYSFDRANLKMLINEQVTKRSILKAFDEYHNIITDQDNLIFYFSGHGTYHNTIQKGYWLTAESVSGERATFFSNDEVVSFIRHLKARHVFGIVDACFSEALFTDRNVLPLVSRRYTIPSRWLLTAGRLEPVSDGYQGDHSPFAEILLSQLKYQDKPCLWVSELCNIVLDGFVYNKEEQLPRGQPLQNVRHKGGEFVFVRKGHNVSEAVKDGLKDFSIADRNVMSIQNTDASISPNVESIDETKANLTYALSDGEWGTVFDQLRQRLKDRKKQHLLIALRGRYGEINNAKIAGTRSNKKIRIEFNQLQMDVLSFINNLQEKDLNHNT